MKEKIYTRQLRPSDYSLSFDLWRAKNGTSMLRYCNILSDLYIFCKRSLSRFGQNLVLLAQKPQTKITRIQFCQHPCDYFYFCLNVTTAFLAFLKLEGQLSGLFL